MGNIINSIIKQIIGYFGDLIKIALLTPSILITISGYIFVGLIINEEITSKILWFFIYPYTLLSFSKYKGATSFHFDGSDFVAIFIIYSIIITTIGILFKFILSLILKREIIIFKNKKVKKYVILTLCNIQFIFGILFLILSDVKIRGATSDMDFIIVLLIFMFINLLILYPYLSIVPQIKIESAEVGGENYKV